METVTLTATSRKERGKGPARRLRAAGMLPTVTYGRGSDTLSLTIEREALRSILLSERGRNTVIHLQVEGGENCSVMVKEFTIHPVSRLLLHADFVRIDETSLVDVEVPFRTTGKALGELEGGTVLVTIMNLKVRCLPAAIPDFVEHDVSELLINDVVKIKDLAIPDGAEPLYDGEQKIVVVQPPRVEVEEEEEGEEGEELAEGEEAEGEDGEKTEGEEGAPPTDGYQGKK